MLWKNKIQNLLFPTAFAQKSDAKDKQKEEGAANVESSGAASLVLIGNHLFAVNGLIEQMGNKDLLLNTMSYLLKDNSLIGIRPKNIREAKLSLTRENLFQVRGIILLGGVMFMLLGIWAVYRRKSVA